MTGQQERGEVGLAGGVHHKAFGNWTNLYEQDT